MSAGEDDGFSVPEDPSSALITISLAIMRSTTMTDAPVETSLKKCAAARILANATIRIRQQLKMNSGRWSFLNLSSASGRNNVVTRKIAASAVCPLGYDLKLSLKVL